jgi:hypothetical protein
MKRAEKQKEWERKVIQYRDSKQSVAHWCAANNESPDRLWYWLRKHKTGEYAAENTALIRPDKWLQVEVCENSPIEPSDGITVKVGKACIEIKPGFEPILLSQVVRVLAASC